MKCQNWRRNWIEREQEKSLLIYSGIRSFGKRREKGEEKEEGRKKSLIRIVTATIIRPNDRRKLHGLAIYQWSCERITWIITDLRTRVLHISHTKNPCDSPISAHCIVTFIAVLTSNFLLKLKYFRLVWQCWTLVLLSSTDSIFKILSFIAATLIGPNLNIMTIISSRCYCD